MTEREKILVEYAITLGLHGEASHQAREFGDRYANDPVLWPSLVEVLLMCRSSRERKV